MASPGIVRWFEALAAPAAAIVRGGWSQRWSRQPRPPRPRSAAQPPAAVVQPQLTPLVWLLGHLHKNGHNYGNNHINSFNDFSLNPIIVLRLQYSTLSMQL